MGASDFLTGSGPRFGARVLADSTLVRRSSEYDKPGLRQPVLQRSRGPIQLSLFDQLEPRLHPLDGPDRDLAPGVPPLAGATTDGPAKSGG